MKTIQKLLLILILQIFLISSVNLWALGVPSQIKSGPVLSEMHQMYNEYQSMQIDNVKLLTEKGEKLQFFRHQEKDWGAFKLNEQEEPIFFYR